MATVNSRGKKQRGAFSNFACRPTPCCLAALLSATLFACGGNQTDTTSTVPSAASEHETGVSQVSVELPSCQPMLDACDGDFAGTWQVRQCPLRLSGPIDLSGFGLGCLEGTTLSSSIEVSGSLQLDAEGQLIDDTTSVGSHEFKLPASCFDVAVVGSCADLPRPLRNFGYESIECAEQPPSGDCICAGSPKQMGGLALLSKDPLQKANVVVNGQRLVANHDGQTVTYEYCGAADILVLSVLQGSPVGRVEGSVVLYREGEP